MTTAAPELVRVYPGQHEPLSQEQALRLLRDGLDDRYPGNSDDRDGKRNVRRDCCATGASRVRGIYRQDTLHTVKELAAHAR